MMVAATAGRLHKKRFRTGPAFDGRGSAGAQEDVQRTKPALFDPIGDCVPCGSRKAGITEQFILTIQKNKKIVAPSDLNWQKIESVGSQSLDG
jgi:hypothetical protein